VYVPVPDVNDPRPAYEQIADDLRQQVKDGRIQVGTRLPSQRELSAGYGVAPGTLRSAFGVLADEGVISRGSTRGTFVLKMPGDPDASPEFERVTEQLAELADRIAALEERVLGKDGDGDG
jgi:DNA-binding GntR family transcriptional regulator